MERERESQRDREVRRLLNVLRRMARTARMNYFMGGLTEKADTRSIEQYNRILQRFDSLEASGTPGLFVPLQDDASLSVLATACRDLVAYHEDEANTSAKGGWDGVWTDARSGIWIDKSAFKSGLPQELNELGHFIREKVSEWQERRTERR
jgi:hypothetical protein